MNRFVVSAITVALLSPRLASSLRFVRLDSAESLGLDAGRVFVTVPTQEEGRLRVLSLNGLGELVEEAEFQAPKGRGRGTLTAALREVLRELGD